MRATIRPSKIFSRAVLSTLGSTGFSSRPAIESFSDCNALFTASCVTVALSLTAFALFNFSLNKKWVFKNQIEVNPKVQSHNNYIDFDAKENTVQTSNTKHYTNNEIIKYSILFFSQMCASGLLVSLLNNLISNATISKLIVDILLFFVSYFIQKNIVFTKRNPENIQRKAL